MTLLTKVKTWLLDLIFPITCLGCGVEGEFLCGICCSSLEFLPPSCFGCGRSTPGGKRVIAGRTCKHCLKNTSIFAQISPFSFQEKAVKELIHGLKYNHLKNVSGILGGLMADYLKHYKIRPPRNSVFIPIPLYPSRKRKRGFNQAELIAKELSDLLGIPRTFSGPENLSSFQRDSPEKVRGLSDILVKIKNTQPQVGLGIEKRKQNPKGCFKITHPEKIAGKTIVLVDDVKTTGATLEEAAKTLKSAGAKRVIALTIAH